MFSNFPGTLHAQTGDRQVSLNLRVPPGGSVGINLAGSDDIRKSVMPLPYKEPGATTMQLLQWLEASGQRLGSMAEVQVGETRPDAPVGTTLALLEQAAKLLDAVHRRAHTAQAEEFAILKRLLSEDPEALWRADKAPPPDAEQILQDLEDNDLQPVADPDVPSHMHRLAKIQGLKQLAMANPGMYDMRAVDAYCIQSMRISDPQRFFLPQQPAQPDPALLAKLNNDQAAIAAKQQGNQLKAAQLEIGVDEKAKDREHQLTLEKMRLAERLATHPQSAPLVSGVTPGTAP
jgi:hypothetical protein